MSSDYREKLLPLAQQKALLPQDVAKFLGTNSIIAAAMLSEMVSKGQLNISNLKVGTSPLYFTPGKEEHLELYYKSLDQKEQQAFALLRHHKVLRENEQNPLIRTCLKNIKDFARPLEVSFKGTTERFYKWHSVNDGDASKLIGEMLKSPKKDIIDTSNTKEPTRITIAEDEPALSTITTPVHEALSTSAKENKEESGKWKLESRGEKNEERMTSLIKKEERKTPTSAIKKEKTIEKKITPSPLQQTLQEPPSITQTTINDPLITEATEHLTAQGISIINATVEKKGSKAQLEIHIPTPVGKVTYCCIVDNKKRINESDLSDAYVKGQFTNLPVLYLTKGQLTKKAQEHLEKLKGLTLTTF